MSASNALVALAGLIVVAVTASDIFQSIIVPRPTGLYRPSAFLGRFGWQLFRAVVGRKRDPDQREIALGFFAPILLMSLLIFWVAALVLGFGALFFALRDQLRPAPTTYWGAAYYAGTALLTLGFGDILANTGLTRAISLVAAALGLGTFAVVVAFLFSLFGAFQRREAFIVTLRERTGAPPSGVRFLTVHAELKMIGDIAATFKDAELWMAEVMETHLAYPILIYFRSTHDEQSWIGTIGALLDASSLLMTTVDLPLQGAAHMLNRLGRHMVGDFSRYFGVSDVPRPWIERDEFATAYGQLRSAGLTLHDEESAWRAFAALRATYAGPLNAMANFFRIPPAQWIGERSTSVQHVPMAPQLLTVSEPASVDAPPEIV